MGRGLQGAARATERNGTGYPGRQMMIDSKRCVSNVGLMPMSDLASLQYPYPPKIYGRELIRQAVISFSRACRG